MHRSSYKTCRALVAAALVGALTMAGPMAASATDEYTDAEVVAQPETDWLDVSIIALDVALLRPLGAIATLGGLAIFVATLPLVAPGGQIETTWDIFVFNQYDDTFVRPIGE